MSQCQMSSGPSGPMFLSLLKLKDESAKFIEEIGYC